MHRVWVKCGRSAEFSIPKTKCKQSKFNQVAVKLTQFIHNSMHLIEFSFTKKTIWFVKSLSEPTGDVVDN